MTIKQTLEGNSNNFDSAQLDKSFAKAKLSTMREITISESCLEKYDGADFDTCLQEEIQSQATALDLESHCHDGGSLDYDDVEIGEVRYKPVTATLIEGHFRISFTESYHAGCKDMEWKNYFAGTMVFILDIETGEFQVDLGGAEIGRVRDPHDDEDEKDKATSQNQN